jgi:tRNA(Arg) A34 adenosine deaminase TadA
MHCEVICINQIKEKCKGPKERHASIDSVIAYVTIEPCVMCAFALNIAGRKVLT